MTIDSKLDKALREAMKRPKYPHIASVVIADGLAQFFSEGGTLIGCMNADDYEKLKAEREGEAGRA